MGVELTSYRYQVMISTYTKNYHLYLGKKEENAPNHQLMTNKEYFYLLQYLTAMSAQGLFYHTCLYIIPLRIVCMYHSDSFVCL